MSSILRRNNTNKYLLLTLVSFLLACVPSVLHRSIWTDEAWTLLLLSGQMLPTYPETVTTPESIQQFMHSGATVKQTLHTLIEDDVHPPAYFLLAKAWASLFGQTLFSLRWLSVALGLASILLFCRFLELSSPALARIATPIFAFSTGVLHYSTEVRHYIFSLLGLVITLYLMGRLIASRDKPRTDNARLVAALIAATSISLLTNYLVAFPIAAAYLWFTVLQSNWRIGFISGLCSLLVFSLWLPFLFQHRPDVAIGTQGLDALSQELYAFDYHAGEIGWQGLPRQLYLILQGIFGSLYIASHDAYPTLLHWAGRLFLASLVAIGAASAIARPEKADPGRLVWLFILLALTPAAGALILYFLVDKQLYALRYMMLAAPGLAALCGMGILHLYRLNARLGGVSLAAALVFLLSVANWGYSSSYFQGKTIYREVAAMMHRQGPGSSLVIAGTGPMPGNTTALLYELSPDAEVLVLRRNSDVSSVLDTAERYDHVWLIRVGALTRAIEDELAESLGRSWVKRDVIEQVEYYEQSAPIPQ
jgi:uncharacterized membrane protein